VLLCIGRPFGASHSSVLSWTPSLCCLAFCRIYVQNLVLRQAGRHFELPSGRMQPRSPSTHRFCLNFINLKLHIYCICTSSTNFEGLLNIRRTAPFFWGGNNNYIYTYHWYIFAVLVEYWGSIAGVKCKYLRSLPTWYIHSLHNLRKWPFDPVDPVLWNKHQSFKVRKFRNWDKQEQLFYILIYFDALDTKPHLARSYFKKTFIVTYPIFHIFLYFHLG